MTVERPFHSMIDTSKPKATNFADEITGYMEVLKELYGKSRKNELPKIHLLEFLRVDTVQAPAALLLLLGLSPRSGFVRGDWNTVNLTSLLFLDGRYVDFDGNFGEPRVGFHDVDAANGTITIPYDEAYKELAALESAASDLFRYWDSGKHDVNNSLEYYVKWAFSKRIPIPWLDEAHRLGFLTGIGKTESESLLLAPKLRKVSVYELNDDAIQSLVKREAKRSVNPYAESNLAYWLKLDTWSYEEGIFLLAGIDPRSVHSIFLDSFPDFSDALPLSCDSLLLQSERDFVEDRSNYPCNAESYRTYRQLADTKDQKVDSLKQLVASLDFKLKSSLIGLGSPAPTSHSQTKRYTLSQFLNWAATESFKPEWLDWAVQQGYVEAGGSATEAPFFDADSDDYPELLHIAVRAWESAKSGVGYTPKQRILAYLSERYPSLSDDARNAIATVANWKKTGGRPKKGG
jgi:hypothetical protein